MSSEQTYPLEEVCSNYHDVDPISLEKVCTLPCFFYVMDPCTKRVYAYDALAWIHYIVISKDNWPLHPCTRVRLDARDIWDCYSVAAKHLGMDHDDIKKIRSNEIRVIKKNSLLKFRPVSPLFVIRIHHIKKIEDNGTDKVLHLKFDLASSANRENIVQANITIKVNVPSNYMVGITS